MASNSAIRQIATSYEGSVFAAADAERAVHIFTLDQPAEVTGFETIFEFGGQRLAISPGGTFCVTGAYNRDGVALYETNGGSLIWHRKDLRGVQRLQFSRHEDAVLASLEGGPLLLLDSRTGATLRDLPGVMDIEESPFGRAKLVCNSARYVFRDENRRSLLPSCIHRDICDCGGCASGSPPLGVAWPTRTTIRVGMLLDY